jgi:hypothetical protein
MRAIISRLIALSVALLFCAEPVQSQYFSGQAGSGGAVIPNYITGGQISANSIATAQGTSSTTTMTINSSPTPTGTFAAGQICTGINSIAGETISSLGTGTGGAGTYNMSASWTQAAVFGVVCYDGTSLKISAGYATDRTNAVGINFLSIGASYTKLVGSAWSAGSGGGGLGNGVTLGASSTYFMCAVSYNSGANVDFFIDNVLACSDVPSGISGTTYVRAINTLITDANSRYIPIACYSDRCLFVGASAITGRIVDLNTATSATSVTAVTVTAPHGLNNVFYISDMFSGNSSCSYFGPADMLSTYNSSSAFPFGTMMGTAAGRARAEYLITSSAVLSYQCAASSTMVMYTYGWDWKGRVN